ncbi:hypothetical protein NXW05_08295 [Phocaeicola vulgatus]|nr:hypothetical protein [Phocaeicola vulgatus]
MEYMNREAIKEEENNLEEYRKKYQNALKAQRGRRGVCDFFHEQYRIFHLLVR